MKKALACIAIASLLSGCSSLPQKITKLNETLEAIDSLGLKKVIIPGRFTNTVYERDGSVSTLTHTNPALSGPIVLVRERKADANSSPQPAFSSELPKFQYYANPDIIIQKTDSTPRAASPDGVVVLRDVGK